MKDFDILPTAAGAYERIRTEYGRRRKKWSISSIPWMEVYASFVASLSFFCSGVVQSYTSPAIVSIESDGESNMTLTRADISWITSSPSLAAFLGNIFSAPMLEHFGRQKSLLLLSLPALVGWLLIGFSFNLSMFHIGRSLTGLEIGMARAIAPLYISEISRTSCRGVLGILPSMMNALGILLGLWVGCWVHWRKLALFVSLFPLLLLFLSLWLPESPIFLLLHEQSEKALRSLERFRGREKIVKVHDELEEMKESIQEMNVSIRNISWRDVLIRKENYMGFSLMIFQQFSGVSAIVYYLDMILSETTSSGMKTPRSLNAENAGLTVGMVHFISFFISLPLIDKVGRRVLLIASGLLMSAAHITLALFLYFHSQPDGTLFIQRTVHWLPITALCTFIAAFSIGFGPVSYVFITEVFCLKYRSYLCSVATLIAQIASFCVLQLFPILLHFTNPSVVFFLHGALCTLSALFVIFVIPETKNKTLAEIEKLFRPSPTLIEQKEELDPDTCCRVEVPMLYIPIPKPFTAYGNGDKSPSRIYCKSPAVL